MTRSLVDDATKKFTAAVQARRDSRRQVDEDRGIDRVEAQRAYEERVAREQAERAGKRGPTVSPDELARRAAAERDTIATLRHLRQEIEIERRNLIARRDAAVELGDLESALEAQIRLTALSPVDGVAALRLRAYGVEVRP